MAGFDRNFVCGRHIWTMSSFIVEDQGHWHQLNISGDIQTKYLLVPLDHMTWLQPQQEPVLSVTQGTGLMAYCFPLNSSVEGVPCLFTAKWETLTRFSIFGLNFRLNRGK